MRPGHLWAAPLLSGARRETQGQEEKIHPWWKWGGRQRWWVQSKQQEGWNKEALPVLRQRVSFWVEAWSSVLDLFLPHGSIHFDLEEWKLQVQRVCSGCRRRKSRPPYLGAPSWLCSHPHSSSRWRVQRPGRQGQDGRYWCGLCQELHWVHHDNCPQGVGRHVSDNGGIS